MWFKNATLFKLTKPFLFTPDELDEQLQKGKINDMMPTQAFNMGFFQPMSKWDRGPLVHATNSAMMVCVMTQEKILPGDVVKVELEKKISQYEDMHGTAPGKRLRNELRESIILDLLPRAFIRTKKTYSYIDPVIGYLVIDTASLKKAEEVCSFLRRCLETLPVVPVTVKENTMYTMTKWLQHGNAHQFEIGTECDLVEVYDKAKVRAKNQEMDANSIYEHIGEGKVVSSLGLQWADKISFTVNSNLAIKKIKYLDLIQQEAADIEAEDQEARFDADFTIMSGTLREFIPVLTDSFGGLNG